MSPRPTIGSSGVRKITNLDPLRVRHVLVGLGPVACVEADERGNSSFAVGRVSTRLYLENFGINILGKFDRNILGKFDKNI